MGYAILTVILVLFVLGVVYRQKARRDRLPVVPPGNTPGADQMLSGDNVLDTFKKDQ